MSSRGHRQVRSHQKGHMNVYYIEKKERKKRFPKPSFWDSKKKTTNLECQRDAMLSIFIIGIYNYVHGDMYTSFYCHTWYFSIHIQ